MQSIHSNKFVVFSASLNAGTLKKCAFASLIVTTFGILATLDLLPIAIQKETCLTTISIGGFGLLMSSVLYGARSYNLKRLFSEPVAGKSFPLAKNLIDQLIEKRGSQQLITVKNSFEYAMLHYELATRTQNIQNSQEREDWREILTKLDHNVRIQYPTGTTFLLDCSVELSRLKGNIPEIEIIKLTTADLKANEGWLTSIYQAYRESFDESLDREEVLLSLLRDTTNTLYVGRNKNNPNEIYGACFIQSKEDGSFFLHSLCRRASATKIHLTENILNFYKTHYRNKEGKISKLHLHVLTHNLQALNLYKKLGFAIEQVRTSFLQSFTPLCYYSMVI